jgi:hypothetical protein
MTLKNLSSVRKLALRKSQGILWMLSVFTLFVLFTSNAYAQTATVVGTVTDPSGAVVANATVKISSLESGLVTNAVTAGDGQFVIPELAIGHYTITATAAGFKSSLKTGILLSVGDRTRIDFQLQVGTAQQTVTVEADQIHLQTDTGEVSDVISSRQVEKLETNGRSIYTLITLTPGASGLQTDDQAPTSVSGNANVSFNGQRMSHNIYLMDGGEDDDRGGAGTFSVVPSLEAIAEFQILTSNYSPEYGLSSAATMSTVIKSGTKSFHGSAWEIDRNDALDADNYFQTTKPELRSNIFGANIGGPVSFHPNRSEPKTFFFYNQEWRRVIQGGSLNTVVPSASAYGGNFTGVVDTKGNPIIPAVPCLSSANYAVGLSSAEQAAFQNAGVTNFSTTTTSSSGVTTCNYDQTFAGNQIPTALINPNATALLTQGKIFPAATSGDYFKGGANSPTFVTEEIGRVDHKFGDKFSVFGHWVSEQVSQGYGTTMWSGDNVPTIGNTFGNPSYSAVVHATYTINPNLLNEIAFNYDGNRIHILPKAAFGATLDYPSSYTDSRVFSGPNTLMPTIDLANTGTQYSANWTPWNNDANDYQIRDDVSWVRGAHQFKFGASWSLYSKAQSYFASPQGDYTFDGNFTNNDFADMLLGFASSGGGNGYQEAAVHSTGQWDAHSYAFYAGDDWHATSRLTVNLGLRWDGVPHTYEANHGSSDFYPSLYKSADAATFDASGNICSSSADCAAGASPGLGTSPVPILAGYQFYLNGVGIGGVNGVPAGLVANHWNAWGPRIGYSYDLTGHGKTVIRSGFGIMYERIQGNDMYDGATNVPFDDNADFNNVSLSDPNLSVSTGAKLTVPVVASSITGLDSNNYKLPDSYQYSAGVQQQLAANTILSVSYVGTQSRHQNDYRENNLPPEGDLAGLIAGTINYNEDVPYKGFVSIKQAENVANGEYNSMQLDLHTVLHHDLQAQFGYTFSKAYDPSTGGGNGFDLDTTDNPYAGWKYDWGRSIFDRRQVAFLNYIYELPIFRHSSNAFATSVLGGWEIAGVSTFESGAPLNETLGGSLGSNGVQNGTNYPNLSGSISYPKTRTSNNVQWFGTSSFTSPAPGVWGNAGHYAINGPGRDEWNIAVHKIFKFSEHSQFEFRAESFNTFNHPQWEADGSNGGYTGQFSSSNNGQITQAYDPRVFQLYGKISF